VLIVFYYFFENYGSLFVTGLLALNEKLAFEMRITLNLVK